jgi:hypothetical protein
VVLANREIFGPTVLEDCRKAAPQATYLGGRGEGANFLSDCYPIWPAQDDAML